MKTEVIDTILELETLGYSFDMDGDRLRYRCCGLRPEAKTVQPLLDTIKSNPEDAKTWLHEYADAFRVNFLFNASDRAFDAARQAENTGDFALANFHWNRFARFFAAGAEMAGVTNPFIPWPDWIKSFDDYASKRKSLRFQIIDCEDLLLR